MSVIDPAMTGWKRKVMRIIYPLNVLMLAAGFVLLCIPAVPVRLALTEIACGALALVTARGPSILAWVSDLARFGSDRMSKSDRAQWESACSLPDVGEMTARWLEGRIGSQPGYCGAPADETRCLRWTLARACRAGFVTTCSQPGMPLDEDGWQQRDAVEGFCDADTLGRLRLACAGTGLLLIEYDPATLPRRFFRRTKAQWVTRQGERNVTAFGVQVPITHIKDDWTGYGICHPDATEALCAAWQVTVIDPQWGRQDRLWPALTEFYRISTGATT
jgi:hypothetical protein